jgi:hypothetical protein
MCFAFNSVSVYYCGPYIVVSFFKKKENLKARASAASEKKSHKHARGSRSIWKFCVRSKDSKRNVKRHQLQTHAKHGRNLVHEHRPITILDSRGRSRGFVSVFIRPCCRRKPGSVYPGVPVCVIEPNHSHGQGDYPSSPIKN